MRRPCLKTQSTNHKTGSETFFASTDALTRSNIIFGPSIKLSMRKKIVAGNWKMNKSFEEAGILTSELMGMVADEVKGNVRVVLCVPFPYLVSVKNQLGKNSRIETGAQNCSEH